MAQLHWVSRDPIVARASPARPEPDNWPKRCDGGSDFEMTSVIQRLAIGEMVVEPFNLRPSCLLTLVERA